MFTDEHRCNVWNEIRQRDVQAFSRQLTPAVFAKAALRAGVKLGRGPLNLANLAWLGIVAAIHGTQSFACILTTTLKLLEDQQPWATTLRKAKKQSQHRSRKKKRSKHDPRRNDLTVVSEAAFAGDEYIHGSPFSRALSVAILVAWKIVLTPFQLDPFSALVAWKIVLTPFQLRWR